MNPKISDFGLARRFVGHDTIAKTKKVAWRLYKEGRSMALMSASLHASCVVPEVLRSIHVALLCVQHHAEDRPTMLSVVLMLVSNGSLPEPKQPAFFSEESSYEHDSIQSVDERTITLMHAR
ncbi:putative non-specific serine/threonine protein kinase [Helianthus anomalus]